MGAKPFTAAGTAAVKPVSSGADTTAASSRFGMPQALVITACIITAAILAKLGMNVQDVLLLIAGAGGIGAAVVVAAVSGGSRAGRIARLMRAYLSAGN
ncbi:hypothetical protein [Streptomyces sp. DSM 118148]|uniref:hypothetical protein n=1 Tax=Streptomyces sp. DSM 118148 TaxID=3448667 RepID=UPI0040401B6D